MTDNNIDGSEAVNQIDAPAEGVDTVTTSDDERASTTTDTPEDPQPDDDSDGESAGGNREAAKYRRRLRETEGERDRLATRLENMQRVEAERQAGEILAKGAALWAGGTTVADLLDDNGDLDPDKIAARAAEIREQFGVPQPRSGLYVPREGYSPPGAPARSSTDSMVDVVMGREQ